MKKDTLFRLFQEGGQHIETRQLAGIRGGSYETDLGQTTEDPDNPGGDPISDCCEDSVKLIIYYR